MKRFWKPAVTKKYHIGRPILPVGKYPCEVLSGFRQFRQARACCFWMKSVSGLLSSGGSLISQLNHTLQDPSVQTWLSVMLNSRLARGHVSFGRGSAPEHFIAVKNDLSPFRIQCKAWSKRLTGSDTYGLSKYESVVLDGLRTSVKWLDGQGTLVGGLHAKVILLPIPLLPAIFMAVMIYYFVFRALGKLST